MTIEQRIEQLFSLLTEWRAFPNYQLERRVDIFFALYLKDILRHCYSGHEFDLIVPEFPLRVGTMYPDAPKRQRNLSVKVDYACFDSKRKVCVLLELKTDHSSVRADQLENMRVAKRKGLDALLKGALDLRSASRSKRKYDALIQQFIDAGLMDKCLELNEAEGPPSKDRANHSIELAIIQPRPVPVDSFRSIDFDAVRDCIRLMTGEDTVAGHLYKALGTWRTAP